ncbi:hypothetical protein [Rhizobium terrae]|uniref:hypothetical protein n=1 Tax=Rhizobium terrae TaxID=2171756 RepID=UPI0013C3466F|nr:hypothetical protein [Rhizobium terrae]
MTAELLLPIRVYPLSQETQLMARITGRLPIHAIPAEHSATMVKTPLTSTNGEQRKTAQ